LIDDKEGLHESMQDSNSEADVLHALGAHEARVEEDHTIVDTERETCSGDDMSDQDEIIDRDEISDKDETSDAEEGKKSRVDEAEGERVGSQMIAVKRQEARRYVW
jgi:hypothetical protein